ncbi:methylated-DNA--[protein]-cysteine S-methyltransferase [Colwellia hornerae]|uniref:Methylated-DNA--protein-cysteine methyltransferase n=2 Tax=Colwellia hornerae TaxID=89402 RepID=A0A5C6Q4I5_9GAMM|nr:methylated-DNA--[protein]-cysteine S-methyltransferase [Colwellia hornerae]TWX45733.1 methylated-DNA--[protein]-cysteine S-methyltransferase [Colwellia hornerae]TWX53606.1 methylated-DNA--[protein]-cysteine S-methyltransferase [Colwellia hornerae]TWX63680.1 methylated-DNA--[protein]-cysteine S-methyltransferase [Colwellia hornerae]
MYFTITPSPYGDIALTANDQGLTALAFQDGALPLIIDESYIKSSSHFINVIQQLAEYFSGHRTVFELSLAPQGTPFQQKVWQALLTIKQGDTKSYLWIAKKINNEKAVRAVGAANGKNPIALIIPCHRVIGANGKLTGYAGGLALKAKLLMHEKAQFSV